MNQWHSSKKLAVLMVGIVLTWTFPEDWKGPDPLLSTALCCAYLLAQGAADLGKALGQGRERHCGE